MNATSAIFLSSCVSVHSGEGPWTAWAGLLLAQGESNRHLAIERLDPLTRAKVLAALTGLIILMFGLMLLASLGARWARNYGNSSRRAVTTQKKSPTRLDDWASKPRQTPHTSHSDEEPPT